MMTACGVTDRMVRLLVDRRASWVGDVDVFSLSGAQIQSLVTLGDALDAYDEGRAALSTGSPMVAAEAFARASASDPGSHTLDRLGGAGASAGQRGWDGAQSAQRGAQAFPGRQRPSVRTGGTSCEDGGHHGRIR